MAAITVLKLTNTLGIVKVTASGTIDLSVHLKTANETLGAEQIVDITGYDFSGEAGSSITFVRNGVTIGTIAPEWAKQFQFLEFSDNVEHASDIVVTISGACEIYFKLRKVSGYQTGTTVDQLGSHGVEVQ